MAAIMKTLKTYKGWAINANTEEGHGLLGRYWWFDGKEPTIPIGLHGHVTAVLRTRREAREALSDVRRTFPKAKIERVTVEVKVND